MEYTSDQYDYVAYYVKYLAAWYRRYIPIGKKVRNLR